MAINYTDNVGDGGTLELNNVKTIATGSVGGDTLVFVGGNDDGISVFRLEDDGTFTSLYDLNDTSALELNNLRELQFAEVGGNPILIAAGNDDGLSTFSVASDGTLTLLDEIEDDGSTLLNNVDGMTVIEVGGTTFVVTGNADGAADEGISVFSLASDGTLVETDQITEDSDSSNLYLDNVRAVAGAEVGGTSFVIAGGDDDGLSVFSVDGTGTLTNVFNLGDGTSPDLPGESLELSGITSIVTTQVSGTTYVYAGGTDDGISVFSMAGDGSLTHVHDYEDGGLLQLTNLRSMTIATSSGGQQYLFVVGDDDALQSYEIGADGSLTLVESFDDTGDTYITNAEDVAFELVDGRMMAIVGGDEDGITGFNVPCFTPGTMILTPNGDRAIETLLVGDLVVVADGGVQPIRLVARRKLSPARLQSEPNLKPVILRKDALGAGVPDRDLVVSPQHRMLIGGLKPATLFGLDQVFAPAKSLLNGRSVLGATDLGGGVEYIHLVFDTHQVIFANGAQTESFFPGHEALDGLGQATRHELLAIFPELGAGDLSRFAPARPLLKAREARLLAG